MQWDIKRLTKALDASVEFNEPSNCYRLSFPKTELKYALHIWPGRNQVLFVFDSVLECPGFVFVKPRSVKRFIGFAIPA